MLKKFLQILAIGVLILMVFAMGMCASECKRAPFTGGEIGLVRLDGTIITADDFIEKMEEARKDDGIRSVLLRIDSPGGSVAASQEMFEEVKKVNAKKPVIVSMGDVAASGGYYAAAGARKIMASGGTITGSIGVRMEHLNIGDLLKLARLEHQTLKSGAFKDLGAMDRKMTPEERAILEGILVNLHEQFKKDIAAARKLPIEKVNELADGRIYSGEQALVLGLVDELGGLPAAVNEAAKAGGIKGEPKIRKIEDERSWLKELFSAKLDLLMNGMLGRSKLGIYQY